MAVTWDNVSEKQANPALYSELRDGVVNPNVQVLNYQDSANDVRRGLANLERAAAQTNTAATLGAAANAYRGATESSIDSAGATLGSAYKGTAATNADLLASLADLVRNGTGGGTDATYGKASRFMDDASRSAAGMSGDVPVLRNMGGTMFDEGSLLAEMANPYLAAGRSLLSLDPSAGGLVGKYSDLLGLLTPDAMVASAASDTQASFDNAAAQMGRQNARRGVSAGSGASAALSQQLARMKAVALAAAKTNARQQGIDRSIAAMRNALTDAGNLGSTGADLATRGANIQSAGAATTKEADNVLNAQGEIYTSLAKIANDTGQLKVQDLNARANAAQVAASISNNTFNAAKAVADNSLTAASYFAGMFNQYATLAGKENIASSNPGGGNS